MNVSESGHSVQAFGKSLSAEKPSQINVAVAEKALNNQKAEGAMLVDMIQKAGSIIDVTA